MYRVLNLVLIVLLIGVIIGKKQHRYKGSLTLELVVVIIIFFILMSSAIGRILNITSSQNIKNLTEIVLLRKSSKQDMDKENYKKTNGVIERKDGKEMSMEEKILCED